MIRLPQSVQLVDVSARDGLQSFARFVDTDTKVAMIDRLSALGLHTVEVSSFAHPKAVPHLADAEAVFERIVRRPGTLYRALVPNARGALRAVQARVGEILGLITATESYTRRNQNMSVDEAVDGAIRSLEIAQSNGIAFTLAIGMAMWCPYEGRVPEAHIHTLVERFHSAGLRSFYLAGSVGMEDPVHVGRLFGELKQRHPDMRMGFHVHNLSGMATANILAALEARVDWLEGAICGIGGGIAMPSSVGSIGNFALEDLVSMLADCDIACGVEPDAAIAASWDVARLLDIEPRSHRAHGATRSAVLANHDARACA